MKAVEMQDFDDIEEYSLKQLNRYVSELAGYCQYLATQYADGFIDSDETERDLKSHLVVVVLIFTRKLEKNLKV